MNQVIYNITMPQPTHGIITLADIAKNISDQLTGQLLYIGAFVVIGALWHMFVLPRGTKTYLMISGMIDTMMLVSGLYLVGLYAVIYWGWAPW